MRNDDSKIEMEDIGICLDDLEQYSDIVVDDVVVKVLNTKMEGGRHLNPRYR